MNRFEKQGITKELIKGRKIIICGSTIYMSHIFREVLQELEEQQVQPDKVIRANGLERIQIGDGELSFVRSPDALRGKQADIVLFSVFLRDNQNFRETWFDNSQLVTQNSNHRYIDVISG